MLLDRGAAPGGPNVTRPLAKAVRIAASVLVLILFVGIGWVGTLHSLSRVAERSDPRAAVALWPSSTALGTLAASMTADPKALKANADKVRSLALRSLRRSPVNAVAARALAVASATQGKIDAARAQIAYGEPRRVRSIVDDRGFGSAEQHSRRVAPL